MKTARAKLNETGRESTTSGFLCADPFCGPENPLAGDAPLVTAPPVPLTSGNPVEVRAE